MGVIRVRMNAQQVESYLRTLNGGWVDYNDTVDTWKAGDPHVEVTGIAVGWMSYAWALEAAARLGCNLFITHEPTFFHHTDADPALLARPEAQAKRAKIDALGLTILRCHDLWDQLPEIGIPDSWGRALGLGQPIGGEGFFRVYDGLGQTAAEIASATARRLRDLGQPGVQLIGPPDQVVRRIVVGTGAETPYYKMLTEYRADLVICTDDGLHYWRDGAHAIDNGHSLLVFHHHVSEEEGLKSLARHLTEQVPGVPVHHIPQTCMYRLVLPD